MSSYVPPFPNLTFKTVFTAALSFEHYNDSESLECHIVASFAVSSTSFYNSSLQANVISRVRIDAKTTNLVDLFLLPSPTTTTSNNLSTIQLTPVLHLSNTPHPDTLINTLKNSKYFSRSLRQLTVGGNETDLVLPSLQNLVALEGLELSFAHGVSEAKAQEFSVVSRLPSLIELTLGLEEIRDDEFGFVDFLGDLENNDGFRKLTVRFSLNASHKNFPCNFARLFARNLLTHLALKYCFTDDDLDVVINVKLTKLQFLALTSSDVASPSKIADAIIASSSSLTSLEVDNVSDEGMIKCAEHLDKLVELRIDSRSVNGSFLREKGSCFASNLEILDLLWSELSDADLQDGFKHLSSLRSLDVVGCYECIGAETLQQLTAARSLEELHLGTITSATFKAVGQLTQLKWLNVMFLDDGVTSDDVVHLKNLVNLRKLTFGCSSGGLYHGILNIADAFPILEFVKLGRYAQNESAKPKFSRDEVTYLLEKCWPKVRYAEFEVDDADTTMPYVRRHFPHVDLGFENEILVPDNEEITNSSNKSQVDDEDDS